MASLAKGKTYWRVVFRKTYDGKQKSQTFYFRRDEYTKKKVETWMRDKEMAFKGGDWLPWDAPARIDTAHTLGDLIEAYKKKIKREVAQTTYELRCVNLDLFAEGRENTPISRITPEVIHNFINEPGKKYPTRKNRKKHLSLFYDYLERYDIDKPRMEVVATKAEKKHYFTKQHKSFLTEAQVLEVISNVKSQRHNTALLKDFYRLAFYTTRRRSELLSIKGEWIFTEPMMQLGDKNNLPKSQMIEYVPLPEKAHEILLRLKQGKKGKLFHFNKRYVSGSFRKALKATYPSLVGKVSLHNLRDSGIMHLLYVEGMSVQKVMEITGHANVRSLELYMHRYAAITYKNSLKNEEA